MRGMLQGGMVSGEEDPVSASWAILEAGFDSVFCRDGADSGTAESVGESES